MKKASYAFLLSIVITLMCSCNRECYECEILDKNGNALATMNICGDDPENRVVERFCKSATCSNGGKDLTAKCVLE
ncbi:MAG: hypothetical protein KDC92_01745 [Bacteroidetes bacterium]|nr:hypothetical protein [Bacteroidota bacterium]